MICAPIPCILFAGRMAVTLMTLMIVSGIGMLIIRKLYASKCDCHAEIDYTICHAALDNARYERDHIELQLVLMKCAATLSVILGFYPLTFDGTNAGPVFFLVMAAIGVFLLILAIGISDAYNRLFSLCSRDYKASVHCGNRHIGLLWHR